MNILNTTTTSIGDVSWCLLNAKDANFQSTLDKIRSGIWINKYAELGYKGVEHDIFDETAQYLALVNDSFDVLGGARLIRATGTKKLPVAQVTNQPIDESLCEISRFCILESSFPDKHDLLALMIPGLMAVQKVVSARNEYIVYANARRAFTKVWRRMGVPFEPIGLDNEHNGYKFTPVRINLFSLASIYYKDCV